MYRDDHSSGDETRLAGVFQLRENTEEMTREAEPRVHVYGRNGILCDTEARGHATPRGRSPLEIVVDASEGFVPLWAGGTTLRWRFQERSMLAFEDPARAMAGIEQLLGEALLLWGDAAPVKFTRRSDAWDFEIVMRRSDECRDGGCVLARAFFPDAGRHELVFYPMMFRQSRQEQLETLVHEIGHIFGLRHFFAKLREQTWPAEVFGTHEPFSIMNYGAESMLTNADKSDLKRLYQMAWSGALTNINGTPIRLVKPFHTTGAPTEEVVAVSQVQALFQPQPPTVQPAAIAEAASPWRGDRERAGRTRR